MVRIFGWALGLYLTGTGGFCRAIGLSLSDNMDIPCFEPVTKQYQSYSLLSGWSIGPCICTAQDDEVNTFDGATITTYKPCYFQLFKYSGEPCRDLYVYTGFQMCHGVLKIKEVGIVHHHTIFRLLKGRQAQVRIKSCIPVLGICTDRLIG